MKFLSTRFFLYLPLVFFVQIAVSAPQDDIIRRQQERIIQEEQRQQRLQQQNLPQRDSKPISTDEFQIPVLMHKQQDIPPLEFQKGQLFMLVKLVVKMERGLAEKAKYFLRKVLTFQKLGKLEKDT